VHKRTPCARLSRIWNRADKWTWDAPNTTCSRDQGSDVSVPPRAGRTWQRPLSDTPASAISDIRRVGRRRVAGSNRVCNVPRETSQRPEFGYVQNLRVWSNTFSRKGARWNWTIAWTRVPGRLLNVQLLSIIQVSCSREGRAESFLWCPGMFHVKHRLGHPHWPPKLALRDTYGSRACWGPSRRRRHHQRDHTRLAPNSERLGPATLDSRRCST